MINAITKPDSTSSATSSTSASNALASATKSAGPNDALGKDTFLKLLVAQLKYQNPLSPMDGTEFIAQTAQLTMTERLTELTTLQQTAVTDANRRAAAEMVGRTISYDNGQSTVEGVVTSARMNAGNPVLMIGKTEVLLSKVLEVRSAPTPPNPAASTNQAATTSSVVPENPPTTTSVQTDTTATPSTTPSSTTPSQTTPSQTTPSQTTPG